MKSKINVSASGGATAFKVHFQQEVGHGNHLNYHSFVGLAYSLNVSIHYACPIKGYAKVGKIVMGSKFSRRGALLQKAGQRSHISLYQFCLDFATIDQIVIVVAFGQQKGGHRTCNSTIYSWIKCPGTSYAKYLRHIINGTDAANW